MEYEINKNELPDGFSIKTLSTIHLDDIHQLLTNNYIEDNQEIIRLVYSRDFLYWYLKQVPAGLVIGLCCHGKLVGMITASVILTAIRDTRSKVAYIDLFCIHKKLRHHGLGRYLIAEIRKKLVKMGINSAIYTGTDNTKPKNPFCITHDYIIPINYSKLERVGFLTLKIDPLPKPKINSLHLLIASDLKTAVPKLNKFMEKYQIRPYFDDDNSYHYLFPKKNIVYTFVRKNRNDVVTDMITVYKHDLYCEEKNEMVGVGQLAFYFHETMTLAELVVCLLEKLPSYDIDQLIFRDMADNMDILRDDITKFSTFEELHYSQIGLSINELAADDLIFFPF